MRVCVSLATPHNVALHPPSCLEEELPSCASPRRSPLSGGRWSHCPNYSTVPETEVAVGNNDWVSTVVMETCTFCTIVDLEQECTTVSS